MLAAKNPPEVFLDAGANFGTHSILFASRGIRSIAFEPNPACSEYPRMVCELNDLQIQWEPFALGATRGEAPLTFPTGKTWLGSIVPGVVENLANYFPTVSKEHVQVRPLDDYAAIVEGKRVLMKIDVEGSEAQVLIGATKLIAQSAPTIIFESNDLSARAELLSLFNDWQYAVFSLPLGTESVVRPLEAEAFRSTAATNFIARRRDKDF